jgi:LPXTG-motif cell wall-anchored protein
LLPRWSGSGRHPGPVQQAADGDGNVTFTIALPATLEVGTHTVTLTGAVSGQVAATFQVVAAPATGTGSGAGSSAGGDPGSGDHRLSSTGTDPTGGVAIGLLLSLIGLTLFAVRRKRLQRTS